MTRRGGEISMVHERGVELSPISSSFGEGEWKECTRQSSCTNKVDDYES